VTALVWSLLYLLVTQEVYTDQWSVS
jgi:hypothetical protein